MKFEIPMEVDKVYIATASFKGVKYKYDGKNVYCCERGRDGFRKVCFDRCVGDFILFMNCLELEEIPQYVTFEEAIEHMKKGGNAQFEYEDGVKTIPLAIRKDSMESGILTFIIYQENGSYTNFVVEWLESKWILL